MKRAVLFTVILMLGAGAAFAELPTDQDYENLEQVRGKIVRMKREMDKFMKDILATYPPDSALSTFGQDIRVDVSETPADVVVRADLPGMAKDKIDITLENSKALRIAGSRDVMKEENVPGVVRQERSQGKFERVIELPVECKSEGIDATYKDGVLAVVIPKKEGAKARPVKVNVQ